MNCTNCGAKIVEGKRFCINCGAPVAIVHYCGDCGAEVPPGATFCGSCGAPQGGTGPHANVVPQGGVGPGRASGGQAKEHGAAVAVAAALLLVVAVGAGGYLVLGQTGNRSGPASAQSGQPVQQPSAAPSLAQDSGGPTAVASAPASQGGAPAPAPTQTMVPQPTSTQVVLVAQPTPILPAAPTRAPGPTTPARPSPATGQAQVDVGGIWMVTETITSAILTGASDKDQQEFQEKSKEELNKPRRRDWQFNPASHRSGTVDGSDYGYDIQAYRLEGDRITVGDPSAWLGRLYEGRVILKGGGYIVEGTFRERFVRSSGATLTEEGNWSAAREVSVPLAIPTLPVRATSVIAPANAGRVDLVRGLRELRDGTILSVAFSPDGKMVASRNPDGKVRLWEAATGKEIRSFEARGPFLALSPDGKMGASGGGSEATLWDVVGGAQPRVIEPGGPTGLADIRKLVFFPDGKVLAVANSQDKTIRLYEPATGKEVRSLPTGHKESIRALAVSPDGKLLATGSLDQTVKVWDVSSGRELRTTEVLDQVLDVAFSPNMSLLATGNNDGVRLWDLASGKRVRILRGSGQARGVWSVAFSPDGRIVAAGGRMNGVSLWEVATGKELRNLGDGEAVETWNALAALAVAFSPDGSMIVTAGEGGKVTLWGVR